LPCLRRLPALVLCGLAGLVLVRPGALAQEKQKEAPPLTASAVKALQKSYQGERAAADKTGLTKKFSPEWYDRAAILARQGAAALKANRLIEARDSFRRARWSLPSLPASLPPHLA